MFNSSKFAAVALLVAAFLFSGPALEAQSCYSQAITSVTTVTVPYSTHGKSPSYSITILDGSGNIKPNGYTLQKNSSNDIKVDFPASQTGTVKICGGYTYPTSHAWDFDLVYAVSGSNSAYLTICDSCGGTYAARGKNGQNAIMGGYQRWSRNMADGTVTVRAWFKDGILVIGTSDNGGGSLALTGPRFVIQGNVSAFPSNVFDLFEGTITTTGGVSTWTSATDLRGW